MNETTGAVTFTPDAGFHGTVETSYVVYDGWGVGVAAALIVTVDPECTITGTPGAVEIIGTRDGRRDLRPPIPATGWGST